MTQHDLIGLVVALTVALAVLVLAEAEPRRPVGAAAVPPACSEWTDGCVVCQRQPDGTPSCSLPGIACVRTAATCLRP